MLSYDISCPVNDVVLFTKNSLATTVLLYNDIRICMITQIKQIVLQIRNSIVDHIQSTNNTKRRKTGLPEKSRCHVIFEAR